MYQSTTNLYGTANRTALQEVRSIPQILQLVVQQFITNPRLIEQADLGGSTYIEWRVNVGPLAAANQKGVAIYTLVRNFGQCGPIFDAFRRLTPEYICN